MKTALQNPHYKKIWEKVMMDRNPEAKILEEALKMERQYYNCFFLYNEIESYVGEYCQNLRRDIKGYSGMVEEHFEGCSASQQEKIWKNYEKKPSILGRPITFEDIILLLPTNSTHFTKKVDGLLQITIFGIDEVGCDFYIGIFNWKLTKFLHEQTPETWEKISQLLNF